MEQAIRAAGIADTAVDPTTDPSRDVELAHSDPRLTRRPSRASLPISHRRSFSTIGRTRPESAGGVRTHFDDSATDGGTHAGDQEEDEMPWGPQHPCFPHPNPHVPLSSPLYNSTRIIRIKRDWMVDGDLSPAYSNVYPEILDDVLPEDRFRALIKTVNDTLHATFSPLTPRNWVDTVMGLLSGWLWDDFGFTGTKRSLKQLESWLEAWNRDVGASEGIAIIPLRRTAYMCLDIQIPDPQILVEGESGPGDNLSTNRGSALGRSGSRSTKGSGGSRRQRHAGLRDDVVYGAYPVVPPIPDRYLEESQMRDSIRRDVGRGTTVDGQT